MSPQRLYDDQGHAYFLTFSCYKRRRLLDEDAPKGIVVSVLASRLTVQEGKCLGFVVMPDHVHALVWFPAPGVLSELVKHWKRLSSFHIKINLQEKQKGYSSQATPDDPVWQRRFYSFNVRSEAMARAKLRYMHHNPVKAGLVERAEEWRFSSARYYLLGQSVGIEITQPQ
ncbi:MAG: transposase [Proteobacteria bacterium]|nr:transposase [Pseudomonadota bacterium]MBU4275210.1 transposase [Pseudomonadota bacterium]MBU4382487.1 transposase [Pseudomonadota bacterium]MBU4604491.1 transposase [Pseudomonadota bacterium]MCG2765004.1 transposase [Desulfarculaceae bacterium]